MLKLVLWVSFYLIAAVVVSFAWSFTVSSIGWNAAPVLGYGLALTLVGGADLLRRVVMD